MLHATDLGEGTDFAALQQALGPALGGLRGRELLDIGCGAGELAWQLASAGARVRGFEPHPQMFAAATAGNGDHLRPGELRTGGLRGRGEPNFSLAGAEELPVANGCADAALFCHSLHHVPQALMRPALAEARRCLRAGGWLCVIEPLLSGSFQWVVEPFHDETEVRQLAQAALARAIAEIGTGAGAETGADAGAATGYKTATKAGEHRRYHYVTITGFADFDAFADYMLNSTFNSYSREQVEAAEIRRRFAACRHAGGYRLLQPAQLDLLRC